MVYVTHDQTEALTFADKVVVMHDGQIVQIGTPAELFERPSHTFVGYFIGSPGMNFLPCRLIADGVRIEGTDLVLGDPWHAAARSYPDARLELGVRPEFVTVTHTPGAASAPASVSRVEDLGNYKLVTARVGPHEVRAKLDEDAGVPAREAHLSFRPARTLIYADGRLVG